MTDLRSLDYDLKRAVSAYCDLSEDAVTVEDFQRADVYYWEILGLIDEIQGETAAYVGVILQ